MAKASEKLWHSEHLALCRTTARLKLGLFESELLRVASFQTSLHDPISKTKQAKNQKTIPMRAAGAWRNAFESLFPQELARQEFN